jgi:cytochrome d ubiquinol oxidase subunit I
VSPGLTGGEALLTLVGFVGVYTGILALYTYVVAGVIRDGPPSARELRSTAERDAGTAEVPGDD